MHSEEARISNYSSSIKNGMPAGYTEKHFVISVRSMSPIESASNSIILSKINENE
jgi:hypothetical protein